MAKLSDILEIPDTAISIGRFQPFTKGHLKLYDQINRKYKHVIIGLAVRKSPKQDSSNPFTNEQREKFIKLAIPGVRVIKVPNLYWETVFEAVGKPVVLAVGTDRESAMKKWGGTTDGSGKFTYSLTQRSGEDISATKVRQTLLDDDIKTFKKMMPTKLHKSFEEMQDIIRDI